MIGFLTFCSARDLYVSYNGSTNTECTSKNPCSIEMLHQEVKSNDTIYIFDNLLENESLDKFIQFANNTNATGLSYIGNTAYTRIQLSEYIRTNETLLNYNETQISFKNFLIDGYKQRVFYFTKSSVFLNNICFINSESKSEDAILFVESNATINDVSVYNVSNIENQIFESLNSSLNISELKIHNVTHTPAQNISCICYFYGGQTVIDNLRISNVNTEMPIFLFNRDSKIVFKDIFIEESECFSIIYVDTNVSINISGINVVNCSTQNLVLSAYSFIGIEDVSIFESKFKSVFNIIHSNINLSHLTMENTTILCLVEQKYGNETLLFDMPNYLSIYSDITIENCISSASVFYVQGALCELSNIYANHILCENSLIFLSYSFGAKCTLNNITVFNAKGMDEIGSLIGVMNSDICEINNITFGDSNISFAFFENTTAIIRNTNISNASMIPRGNAQPLGILTCYISKFNMENITLNNNTALTGCFFLFSSEGNFSMVNAQNSMAVQSAVFTSDSSVFNVTDSTFNNNKGKVLSGVAFLGNTNTTFSNCHFLKNEGEEAGVLNIQGNSSVHVKDSIIKDNKCENATFLNIQGPDAYITFEGTNVYDDFKSAIVAEYPQNVNLDGIMFNCALRCIRAKKPKPKPIEKREPQVREEVKHDEENQPNIGEEDIEEEETSSSSYLIWVIVIVVLIIASALASKKYLRKMFSNKGKYEL